MAFDRVIVPLSTITLSNAMDALFHDVPLFHDVNSAIGQRRLLIRRINPDNFDALLFTGS